MADVSTELTKLRKAVYGEEVRGAFISSIEKMNEEASHAEEWATGGSGGAAYHQDGRSVVRAGGSGAVFIL